MMQIIHILLGKSKNIRLVGLSLLISYRRIIPEILAPFTGKMERLILS